MKDLGWQTLDIRWHSFLSTLMHKCIKGNAPVRLTNELIITADTHDCNTRASTRGVLQVPKPSSELLGAHLDTKGLHSGIVCHPISKMPRILIVSSASIRSGSSNDHMSGTLIVYMYVLETCYRTHLFGPLSLILFKSSTMIYAFYFIGHLVLKYI